MTVLLLPETMFELPRITLFTPLTVLPHPEPVLPLPETAFGWHATRSALRWVTEGTGVEMKLGQRHNLTSNIRP